MFWDWSISIVTNWNKVETRGSQMSLCLANSALSFLSTRPQAWGHNWPPFKRSWLIKHSPKERNWRWAVVGVSQPVSQAKAPLSPTLEDRYLELVSPKLTLRFNVIESLWALLAIWSQHTNTPTLNWNDFPSLPLHVLMCWMEVCKNLLGSVCVWFPCW